LTKENAPQNLNLGGNGGAKNQMPTSYVACWLTFLSLLRSNIIVTIEKQ